MVRPARTGAERYFAKLAEQPAFAEAYDEARRRIDQIDRLVLDLDQRREALSMTKAELARRAGIAPEAVRRLFSVDGPNPTIGTLAALADSLGLELVSRERGPTTVEKITIAAKSRTDDCCG
jgi:DNA-binding phage protein